MHPQAKGAANQGAPGTSTPRCGIGTDRSTTPTGGCPARVRPGLRWCDPRHVDPELLRRPGQGDRRRVPLRADDSGGVHTNSGVVNHTFALMVDGGTYNSVTVAGIGLDKAANLFWQAQAAHLGPISDFRMLADSLEASCTELTGSPSTRRHTPNAAARHSAAMITRPTARRWPRPSRQRSCAPRPTQCDFQPLLQPGAPALVRRGHNPEDRLHGGLRGRTGRLDEPRPRSSTPVAAAPVGGRPRPRRADTPAVRGVDDDVGACTEGAGDFSSRDTIISPRSRCRPDVTAPKLSSTTTWPPSPASTAATSR